MNDEIFVDFIERFNSRLSWICCIILNTNALIMPRKLNLIGQKFGTRVVVAEAGRRKTYSLWRCRCEKCGTETDIESRYLPACRKAECRGCLHILGTSKPSPLKIDITGQKLGTRIVLREHGESKNNRNILWECRCENCGKISLLTKSHLHASVNAECKGCIKKNGKMSYPSPRRVTLTGQKFGTRIVLGEAGKQGYDVLWQYRCEKCGNEAKGTAAYLRKSTECRKCLKESGALHNGTKADLIGRKFGTHLVLAEDGKCGHTILWKYRCEKCGIESKATARDLRSLRKCRGCLSVARGEPIRQHLRNDFVGQKFGTYVVVATDGKQKDKDILWRYRCEKCGTEWRTKAEHLRTKLACAGKCKRPHTNRPSTNAIDAVYNTCENSAKIRDLEFNISKDDFIFLSQQPCRYCGEAPARTRRHKSGNFVYWGLDRIENNRGYLNDNCCAACPQCNRMKLTQSFSEFMAHVDRIHDYQKCPLETPLSNPVNFLKNKQGNTPLDIVFKEYKENAKSRNLPFEILFDVFAAKVQKQCSYCGANPEIKKNGSSRNGLDRVDSGLGYTEQNTVTACRHCNWTKSDMTVSDFLAHIEKIYRHNHRVLTVETQPLEEVSTNAETNA